MSAGPFRVVKRRDVGGDRIWDVYSDTLGDYLATMNPTLPVSSEAVAQRICDAANDRGQSKINEARCRLCGQSWERKNCQFPDPPPYGCAAKDVDRHDWATVK